MSLRPAHLPAAALVLAILACGSGPGDEGKLGPTDVCDALCALAADCAAADQGADAAALQADCAQATAALPVCAPEDSGDAEDRAACTAALGDRRKAADCAAFSGDGEINVLDAGPEACVDADGFAEAWDAAMISVAPPGAAGCAALAAATCARLADCVDRTEAYDPTAGEAPPADACETALAPWVEVCVAEGRFDYSLEGNTLREGAEACAAAMTEERVACEDLLTGSPPAACAAAFANVREASSYAATLSTLAAQYVVLD
jgi:hypothetical protein